MKIPEVATAVSAVIQSSKRKFLDATNDKRKSKESAVKIAKTEQYILLENKVMDIMDSPSPVLAGPACGRRFATIISLIMVF